MRILHVLDHSLPEQSGYSFRSHAILREQRKLGWDTVQVTSPKHGISDAALELVDCLDYHRTIATPGPMGRLPVLDQLDVVLRLRREVARLVAEYSPDVIQAHSPLLNALAALGLGRPLVYELRSSWEDAAVSQGTTTEGSLRYRATRFAETFVLRRADAVTTICEGLRRDVIARGVPADRITVVPNAADVETLDSRAPVTIDLRRQFGLADRFVIGFIGSFFAWEGLTLLIDALPRIAEELPDLRVLLVGGGPDEPAIRAAVARNGLEQRVIFTGRLRHDEVRAAYEALDLLVYPRLPMRLTEMVTPLKPLEALTLGRTLVASDVGGHRELIRDGVTGILFRAGDPAALANAVIRVATDPEHRGVMAAAGRRYILEERTWSRVVRSYEQVYGRVLEQEMSRAAAERR